MMYGSGSSGGHVPNYMNRFNTGNTSFGGGNAQNLGTPAATLTAPGKFAFKNFIGDGNERKGSEKSGENLTDDKSSTLS
jgi:hypothetical protein